MGIFIPLLPTGMVTLGSCAEAPNPFNWSVRFYGDYTKRLNTCVTNGGHLKVAELIKRTGHKEYFPRHNTNNPINLYKVIVGGNKSSS